MEIRARPFWSYFYVENRKGEHMETEVITAIIALIGSALGTFTGIAVNSKLTNYRLERLEAEVRVHNDFAHRMPVLEEKILVANHRITDLEEKEK